METRAATRLVGPNRSIILLFLKNPLSYGTAVILSNLLCVTTTCRLRPGILREDSGVLNLPVTGIHESVVTFNNGRRSYPIVHADIQHGTSDRASR